MPRGLCLDLDGFAGPLRLGDTGRRVFVSGLVPRRLTARHLEALGTGFLTWKVNEHEVKMRLLDVFKHF